MSESMNRDSASLIFGVQPIWLIEPLRKSKESPAILTLAPYSLHAAVPPTVSPLMMKVTGYVSSIRMSPSGLEPDTSCHAPS